MKIYLDNKTLKDSRYGDITGGSCGRERSFGVFFILSESIMNEKDMQHGFNYNGKPVRGWIATEKFNGCRAYWDGEYLWSRGGIKINFPESWLAVLPAGVHLDGEVYDGIDGFHRTVSAVKYGNFTPSMRLMVFDSPSFHAKYLERLAQAKQYEGGPVIVVDSFRVINIKAAILKMQEIHARGGEGLVLRHPDVQYIPERTDKLLKLKKDPSQNNSKKKSLKRRPRWTNNAHSFSIAA